MSIELRVNGKVRTVEADPATPLIFVLRNDLHLKSPKLGCGLEQCGACKVLVDGEAVMSCVRPVGEFEGKEITTIEAYDGADPLQRAFLEHNAAQCGYCTSGILIGARALLDRNPHPGEAEIREALKDNLCRCGSHPRVLRAIRSVVDDADA
ncbi:MAG: (2Fe-2S)-binding protein [Pseudomonadales bacterium]